jgi:phospholipid-translocating ATPase
LKEKICPKQTKDMREQEFVKLRGGIDCDGPNEFLDAWEGNLKTGQMTIPVDIKNLGLRGTTLRNTEYILGIAVYTGHSTKIMKNAKNPPSKMSAVLRKMNQILYSV